MNDKPAIAEFTDGSAFTLFFESPERVRILDVVLSRKSLNATTERIATLANVDVPATQEELDFLEEFGVLNSFTEEDGEQVYRLNSEGVTDDILSVHDTLSARVNEVQSHLYD